MTVCIAAIAYHGQAIVIATDQMISTGVSSGDAVAVKILGVHRRWAVMYAGSPTHVSPVLGKVRAALRGKPEVTYQEIETALTRAYQERLQIEAANQVLGRYGMSMADFLSEGPTKFGEANFTQHLAEIRQVSLGPEGLFFLVAGYDDRGIARIFSVVPPGATENHEPIGFWAIGSGQYNALGSLFFHSFNKGFTLSETVYHVCEAKFMAEKAVGVGPTTSVLIIQSNGLVREVQPIETIKMMWQSEGRPRVPGNLISRMDNLLNTTGSLLPAALGETIVEVPRDSEPS